MKRKGAPEARAADGGGGGGGGGGDASEGGGGGGGEFDIKIRIDVTPAFVIHERKCKQNCLSMLRRAEILGHSVSAPCEDAQDV